MLTTRALAGRFCYGVSLSRWVVSPQRSEPRRGIFPSLSATRSSRPSSLTTATGQWRRALNSVQGIYLIACVSKRRLHVGKADGTEPSGTALRWRRGQTPCPDPGVALLPGGYAGRDHVHHFVVSAGRGQDAGGDVAGPPGVPRGRLDQHPGHGGLGLRREYAKNGHGGNVALRELAAADDRHRQHFQFSILQFFSPSAPAAGRRRRNPLQEGSTYTAVRHGAELTVSSTGGSCCLIHLVSHRSYGSAVMDMVLCGSLRMLVVRDCDLPVWPSRTDWRPVIDRPRRRMPTGGECDIGQTFAEPLDKNGVLL